MYCLFNRKFKNLVIGLSPSIILLLWYILENRTSTLAYPLALSNPVQFVLFKLYTIMKAGPYHNFIINDGGDAQKFTTMYVVGILLNIWFLLALILFSASMVWSKGVRWLAHSPEAISAAILVIIMLGLPENVAGIANPGERLLYPALILASTFLFNRTETAVCLQSSLGGTIAVGLLISVVSLAVPGLTQLAGRSAVRIDQSGAGGDVKSRLKFLFGHRLQYDEEMQQAERSWKTGDVPTLPLAFDTALIGNREPSR
jgi:hypothetical protein